MTTLFATVLMATALAKRAEVEPPLPEPPVVEVVAPITHAPGSLWDDRSGFQMVGLMGGQRSVGDLITVQIVERLTTTLDAQTATGRKSKTEAGVDGLLGAETTIPAQRPSMGGRIAVSGSSSATFDGGGRTARGGEVRGELTCEVIAVLPDGNLRVWGYKKVRVNREIQYAVLDGIVRPRDIALDNTVSSQRLARATLEFTGSGVVGDNQGPGVITRIAAWLWPF